MARREREKFASAKRLREGFLSFMPQRKVDWETMICSSRMFLRACDLFANCSKVLGRA